MRLRSLCFLTALNMLNYLDRYLVAALLPLLTLELHLTMFQGGLLHSAFVCGYAIFSPILGTLADRGFSRPKLMAIGIFVWSLASALSGVCSSIVPFVLARVLVGVGEAGFGSVVPGYLKDRQPDSARLNTVLAIFYCAIPVGSALGYVVGGILAENYGWRSAFLVPGILGMLLAPMLLTYPDVRTKPPQPTPLREGIEQILTSPITVGAILGYVFNSFALNGVATFVTTHGTELGYEASSIQFRFGIILVITGFGGTLLGGRIAEALARRAKHPQAALLTLSAVSSIVGTPFLYWAFATDVKETFLFACFCAELAVFMSVAPLNTVIVLSCPQHLVTLTQGLTILAINLIGSFLAPISIGWIADETQDLGFALQMTTVALAVSGVVWFMTASRARRVSAVG